MLRFSVVSDNHDSALAVFDKNKLLFASQSERFSKIKNDPRLSLSLVDYAVSHYGMPEEVLYFETPSSLIDRAHGGFKGFFKARRTKKSITREIQFLLKKKVPVHFLNHHLSHAATGVYTSSFTDAAVVVLDAIGQCDTVSFYDYHSDRFETVKKVLYPDSICLLYSAFTQRLGFTPNRDEYQLMGLAAYGKPIFYDRIIEDFIIGEGINSRLKVDCRRGIDNWMPNLTQEEYKDVAASIQKFFEYYVLALICYARTYTESNNLILGGGGFLNCVANGLIARSKVFDKIWINPNPGDAGSVLGAQALITGPIDYKDSFLGLNIGLTPDPGDIVCDLLSGNPTVLCTGRAEFGPRALGNRSILMDPRKEDSKAILNKIKQRQAFRPFAPAILSEYVDDYFVKPSGIDTSFMQYTLPYRDNALPGYRHPNSQARVQSVKPGSSLLRAVLERWFEMTGCPVLLNTSLNVKDKPIVNDKRDLLLFHQATDLKIHI